MDSSSSLPLDPDILLEHSEFLSGLAAQLVGDSSDAQDVVQETLLSAVRRPPEDASSIRAWLARVAKNHALQLWRARRRRSAREELAARREGVPSTSEIVERENARRAVVEALLALSEPYRSVILLRYYEDLPPREVAARLKIPVETVRTRLKRGLAALRAELDRRYSADRGRWVSALAPLAFPRALPLAHAHAHAATSSSAGWILSGVLTLAIVAVMLTLPKAASDDRGTVAAAGRRTATQPVSGVVPGSKEEKEWEQAVADAAPEPRRTLAIDVVSSEDLRPLPGIPLRMERGGALLAAAISNDLGSLTIELPDLGEALLRVVPTDSTLGSEQSLDLALFEDEQPRLTLRVAAACRVAGRTVDGNGQALPAVEVIAFDSLHPSLAPEDASHVLARVRSDSSGRFTLGGLPRRFYLHAQRDEMVAVAGFAAQFKSSMQVDEIEFVLEPAWQLAGRVVDEAGMPMEGALIDAVTIDRRGNGRSTGIEGASWRSLIGPAARTRADGSFELTGVPPRTHQVRAELPGYTAAGQIASEDGALVLLELHRGAELDVSVRNSGGQPVAGARVEFAGAAVEESIADTGPNGGCRFVGVEPNARAALRVEADGYATALQPIELDERSHQRVAVVLGSARSAEGRVLESDGSPVRGATVVARPTALAIDERAQFLEGLGTITELARTTTDEAGRFRLDRLGEGPYEFEALPSGEDVPRGRAVLEGEQPIEIALTPRSQASLVFHGRVVDALSHAPIARFCVTARATKNDGGRSRAQQVVQAVGGRFELGVDGAGAWAFAVKADGYAPWFVKPSFYPTGTHQVDVELWPARSLSVRVIDRCGAPITEARLLIEDRRGQPIAAMISPSYWTNVVPLGPRGEAEILGLPAREVFVRVRFAQFDLPNRFRFDLCAPIEGTQELHTQSDPAASRRPIELVLYEAAPGQRGEDWLYGRFHVEVTDAEGAIAASFDGVTELTSECHVERPLRCLVQRFQEDGSLAAHSMQQLVSDTLARERGPRADPNGTPRIQFKVPLGACRISVTSAGFAAAHFDLPAAAPDDEPTVAVKLVRVPD